MAHAHDHTSSNHGKAFMIGIFLNTAYVVMEVIYGLIAHSSALLADAGHNAGDVLSLGFSWGALAFALKKPSPNYTYGLKRMSILASILNALILLVTMGIIAGDAIHKFKHLENVDENIVMWVAAVGILINGFTAWLFMKGQKEDLNIKGAFLHMAADAAVALGVVIAGFIIKLTHYNWIDPVMCFIIIIVVVWGTWGLLKDSVNLALDAVPEGISIAKVKNYFSGVKGVKGVYDLHIWGMSTTQTALSVHLLVPDHKDDNIIMEIREQLHEQFEITHPTIQIIHDEKFMAYKKDCVNG
ncbi:cation diffusion facilitator family transporter [Mucilaginibacter gossypii]|uniref:Cobalt-zinc-cadmium efflux system protein n=1 Tax=Mucilaginibacter gossypii TaxID=551996 RepID=A0A1G7RMG6_9SPHI|nr:cation diffusion facilitator family transporter [Mucilaginibacter gossypii]SDG11893.1 cobalt-zinc-cadmium efflux system protein [Mucilaginibacter gossypii]